MRIGIDVSPLQGESALRGMGRYTWRLIESLCANPAPGMELYLFHQPPDSQAHALPPIPNPTVAQYIAYDFPAAGLLHGRLQERRHAETYSQQLYRFLLPYTLDVFHLTANDDNLNSPALLSWGTIPLIITVLDLIPYHLGQDHWHLLYADVIALLNRADALLAISEATRQDVVQSLAIDANQVFVSHISPSALYSRGDPDVHVLNRWGLQAQGYIFSITGSGWNKNLVNMLQAYALLPSSLRATHPFVIGGGMQWANLPPEANTVIKQHNLHDSIRMLGWLPETDIVQLYRGASVYMHVSRAEGFGMPLLEAQQIGSPVLTADLPVLHEVAGKGAVYTPPEDVAAIAQALQRLLTDETSRNELRIAGFSNVAQFTEAQMATQSIAAYEHAIRHARRPRITVWSPWPPQETGVADYSAPLATHLGSWAQVALAPDDIMDDSVPVYHISNNAAFHSEIYAQALKHPGIVVLHELSLLDFQYHRLKNGGQLDLFQAMLAQEVGERAARRLFSQLSSGHVYDPQSAWLVSELVAKSKAIVVHNDYSAMSLRKRYPQALIIHIPLATSIGEGLANHDQRQNLGISSHHFVIGIFGHISHRKPYLALIEALAILRHSSPQVLLLVVGRSIHDPFYAAQMHEAIARHQLPHKWVENPDEADFVACMQACDVVVNLRRNSPGETSAITMRAFGQGKVVLASDIPNFRGYPKEFCWLVRTDEGEVAHLIELLTRAIENPSLLEAGGQAALMYAERFLGWDVVAQRYVALIRSLETPQPSAIPLKPAWMPVEPLPPLNHDSQRHLESAYADWDYTRIHHDARSLENPLLRRYGLLRFIYRFFWRLRNLGTIWGKEASVLRGLLDQQLQMTMQLQAQTERQSQQYAQLEQQIRALQEHLTAQATVIGGYREALDQQQVQNANFYARLAHEENLIHPLTDALTEQIARLDAVVERLDTQDARMEARLDEQHIHIRTEIAQHLASQTAFQEMLRSLHGELQQFIVQQQREWQMLSGRLSLLQWRAQANWATIAEKQAQAAQQQQESLVRLGQDVASLMPLASQVRLHESRLRALMPPEAASHLDGRVVLACIKMLESRYSFLAEAQPVSLSLYDSPADTVLETLLEYFGERIGVDGLRVWYHLRGKNPKSPVYPLHADKRMLPQGCLILLGQADDMTSNIPAFLPEAQGTLEIFATPYAYSIWKRI